MPIEDLDDAVASIKENAETIDAFIESDENTDVLTPDGTSIPSLAKTQKELSATGHPGNTDNPHGVTKTQIGLSNVDNTADTDKPISTAQQTALDAKAETDLANVDNESVTLAMLAADVTSLLGTGFDPAQGQGNWNPATNSPTIPAAGTAGRWYRVSVAGTASGTNADGTYEVNDVVVDNGSNWILFRFPTLNLADGLVTKAKLSTEVERQLNKALGASHLLDVLAPHLDSIFRNDASTAIERALITDDEGKKLLTVTKRGEVAFSPNFYSAFIQQLPGFIFEYFGFSNFTGSQTSGVVPLIVDQSSRVLMGYDLDTKRMIGIELEESSLEGLTTLSNIADRNGVILYGQSNSLGYGGQPALSTSQNYDTLMFNGGVVSGAQSSGDLASFTDLVEVDDGSTGETAASGFADYLKKLLAKENATPYGNEEHQLIVSAAGLGSTDIDNLDKGSARYNGVFTDHFVEMNDVAVGLAKTFALQAVVWFQGERDRAIAEGGLGTSKATYKAKFIQLAADITADAQADNGQAHPVRLISFQLAFAQNGGNDVAQAQIEAARETENIFIAFPTYFIPHNADTIHFSNVGHRLAGHYVARVYHKTVVAGKQWLPLDLVSAVCESTTLELKFFVPVKPLQLGATLFPLVTDYGFKVVDDTGTLSLSDFKIINGDTVQITLNRALGDNPKIRYGLDYAASGINFADSGGNLHDSALGATTISGTTYKLHNACVLFEENIIDL